MSERVDLAQLAELAEKLEDDSRAVAAELVEQAIVELRRLRADEERIDWLQSVSKTSTVYMNNQHPWNMAGNLKLRDLRGPTLREAIDAARAVHPSAESSPTVTVPPAPSS